MCHAGTDINCFPLRVSKQVLVCEYDTSPEHIVGDCAMFENRSVEVCISKFCMNPCLKSSYSDTFKMLHGIKSLVPHVSCLEWKAHPLHPQPHPPGRVVVLGVKRVGQASKSKSFVAVPCWHRNQIFSLKGFQTGSGLGLWNQPWTHFCWCKKQECVSVYLKNVHESLSEK